jgi:large subunit ribosomal protein L23
MRKISDILVKPLVTEKTHRELDKHGAYTFVVNVGANKIEIAQAIEKQFSVKVKDVRTMRYVGKEKRMGRFIGRKASWKKAVVTLVEGDTIEIFEGV